MKWVVSRPNPEGPGQEGRSGFKCLASLCPSQFTSCHEVETEGGEHVCAPCKGSSLEGKREGR